MTSAATDMSSDTITKSVSGHLELVNKAFLWSLALAATLIISGTSSKTGTIKIIGLDVDKSRAYLLAGFGYIFANTSIIIIALRIRDLFSQISDDNLIEGLHVISVVPTLLTRLLTSEHPSELGYTAHSAWSS
jgi:hypothetical protein